MTDYKLFWTDATLAENYQNEQDFINTMKRDKVEIEITADGEWYDYEAAHNFEADNDKKALEHVKDFDFNGRTVDVFTLSEGKREVAINAGRLERAGRGRETTPA